MTSTAQQRTIPRDGRLLALILASKNISDADERVIHQLLDFAHREDVTAQLIPGYTAEVLQAAQGLSDHAARTGAQAGRIEKEDVELAIQMRRRAEFVEPPPRDYLANLAHDLNAHPLPPLPESFEVVRLPPPSQRLGEVTFDLVPSDAAFDERQSDSESGSDSDGDEEVEGEGDGEGEDAEAEAEDDGDDEMVEVGVEREVDEDYDA